MPFLTKPHSCGESQTKDVSLKAGYANRYTTAILLLKSGLYTGVMPEIFIEDPK